MSETDPPRDCDLCPRLVEYRLLQREKQPAWFNAPVPTFGDLATAELLVVGLAPGVGGANRTGRPFTGDYAGDLLYPTLVEYGFAQGTFAARPDDGLTMARAAVTNAVRCVPPQNKPVGAEINTCRPFLVATMDAMPRLSVILTLGRIAHDTVLRTLRLRTAQYPFRHGVSYETEGGPALLSSYHPSRYNVNTRVLTDTMFREVVATARRLVDDAARAPA